MKLRLSGITLLLGLLAGCATIGPSQHQSATEAGVEGNLNPSASRHVVKGAFHESMDDPRRAVYEYNLALLHDSTSVEIRRALAENYLQLGEYETFAIHALSVLDSEPDNRRLRSRLAIVYHHLGDLPATIGQLEYLLTDIPPLERDDPVAGEERLLTLLLELHATQVDTSAFISVMHDLLAKDYMPEAEALEMYHGMILTRESTASELEFLQQLSRARGEPFYLQLLQVDLLAKVERLDEAEQLLRVTCSANEDKLEAWFALAFFQRVKQSDNVAARQTLQDGLRNFPDAMELRLELADLEEECGNLTIAEQLLLELIAAQADAVTGRLYLSDFYQRHTEFREEALALYHNLLVELALEDATLMNNYAYLLVEDERSVSAEQLLVALEFSDRSLELEPDNASFLDTNGWIYYCMGNLDEAAVRLQQALRFDPEQPVILEHYARVLDHTDRDEAELMRRRAAEYRRQMMNNTESP
ncbi:MAG: hypothetical protein ISR91_02325 [Candidatus Delongbacteria bacterium]|nr:hypothetical protein [bacterium]MBL7032956.1 hypothetical protein [Candidatus Delongbacteria bacterium]